MPLDKPNTPIDIEEEQYYSTCRRNKPISEFSFTKLSNIRKKTYNIHNTAARAGNGGARAGSSRKRRNTVNPNTEFSSSSALKRTRYLDEDKD